MAGGIWNPTEKPVLPGLYLNFKASALASIQPGSRGVVGAVVKAHWGKVNDIVEISSEADIINNFTDDISNGATAYTILRFILMGGAKKVIAYRVADSNVAKATLTLKDSSNNNMIKIDAKYEGSRGNNFKIAVQTNPVDSNKKDVKLYENATLLKTFTVPSGADNIVNIINSDPENVWIVASKVDDGTGILANITATALTGGNSGIAGVQASDYVNAMAKFETQDFNVFVLDGVSDSSIQASLKAWVERLRNEGKGIIAVIGGSKDDDKSSDAVSKAISRSTSMNYEGIVNVGVGAYLGGVEYSSGEIASWVAGLIAGQKLSESTTYAVAPFSDVNRRWTKSEMETAVKNGVFLLYHDGEKVKCLKGINTLTSLRQGQNEAWKKIRTIRVMDAINSDLGKTAEDSYIGKVNNTEEGRNALIGACKEYMRTLALGGVIENKDWNVYIDPDYTPLPDEVYIRWEAKLTDVMEKIFGTFIVK